ncbi:hypothetical protein BEWA_011230 [Theileria equi strain WA]|uniref:RNA-editing substrate-binding complex 6 protein domain-containing protein n=1 Tax=Theileria equi strain WA TaxID=1537102 RepID=L0B1K0_THEEQ|nr:hypothetical protein BEWA_011230 [Theileria equi strain WA]AFZ81705.1 hypothetical protein BEWA_011230 [Theileria equi strain WA]|eukprot:XP_004831371.1 hypothetical protein BEWA_011230 [Theileria equi strain WA]
MEFLENFNGNNESQLKTLGNHTASVKPIKGKTIPLKERFNQGLLEDEDMYSGKPVWQQLNDIESIWKVKFKHKSRIKIQRDISKAKKSVETLEELENNANSIYLDDIRNINKQESNINIKGHLPSEETLLINDINLQGKACYEQPTIQEEKYSIKDNNSLIDSKTIITREDEEFITEIFGNNENVIDATTPSAIIESNTNIEPEKWLNMNPNHIIIQQTIIKSKIPSQILSAITDKHNQLNPINSATALHRLAKQIHPYNRHTILNHKSFGKLISVIEVHIPEFDSQGLTNILWSIVRIKITPTWLSQLLTQIDKNLMVFNANELSSCLLSLSKVGIKNNESLELRSKLVALIRTRINGFKTPLELTCVSTGLARFNVRDPILFGHISRQIIDSLDKFTMNELRGVAWSFAYLGFNDRLLFANIRNFIENNANETNVKNVIRLAWALSKLKEADSELFLFTISPLIRSNISNLTCKDISTIAWAFLNAEIEDCDLFNDLATALQHQMEEMTTHDITSCVATFSHIEASHRVLFNKMKTRAVEISNEFTPLQLAKIIRGFSYFSDEKFYSVMSRVVESKLPLMSPENILEVLVGFTEAKIVPDALFSKLLHSISKNARKMYAEDSLMLLNVANELRGKYSDRSFSKLLTKLSRALLEQIEERVSKWRCFDISQISLVFKCMKENLQQNSIVKTLSKQLVPCLNRLYSSNLSQNEKVEIFSIFLESSACLNTLCIDIIRTEITKNAKLITIYRKFFTLVKERYDQMKSENKVFGQIDVVFLLVKLGFIDNSVISMCDDIILSYESKKIDSWDHITKTIWFLTEAGINHSWIKEKIAEFLVDYESEDKEHLDYIIRIMWSCVVLGNDDVLMQILQKHLHKFNKKMPKDMLCAQQIALHILKCLPIDVNRKIPRNTDAEKSPICNISGDIITSIKLPSLYQYTIGEVEFGILTDWLQYQREDLFAITKNNKRHVLEIDHESWISECLISMKIPHKAIHVVENVYRISVSFPVEKHLIDVITFKDMLAPDGKIRASALLRQRQLQYLGYGISSIKLPSLYQAIKEKTAKNLIAKVISDFNPTAKEQVSFRNLGT